MKSLALNRLLPFAALFTAAALGASSGLYIKGLAFSSLAMAGFRMSVPFLIVIPFVARRGLLLGTPGYRKRLYFASVLNALRLLLYVLSFKYTSIANAVALLYLWPVFTLVIDGIQSRRRLDMARVGVLSLASIGVALMNAHQGFSVSGKDLIGSGFMIVSAFLYAISTIIFKQALKDMRETDIMYFQNGAGAIIFLPFLIAAIPGAEPGHVALGLLYGLAVGFAGFGLFFVAMKRLPLFQYSALSYTEILFGLAFGIMFRGDVLRVTQVLGVIFIVAGSYAAQRLRVKGLDPRSGPPVPGNLPVRGSRRP